MRDLIKLVSTDPNSSYYYTTSKNKRKTTHKLEFKKFDPTVRKHVLFKEDKIK